MVRRWPNYLIKLSNSKQGLKVLALQMFFCLKKLQIYSFQRWIISLTYALSVTMKINHLALTKVKDMKTWLTFRALQTQRKIKPEDNQIWLFKTEKFYRTHKKEREVRKICCYMMNTEVKASLISTMRGHQTTIETC